MKWSGEGLKRLIPNVKGSVSALADALGVSRQTVYDWMEGQVPKGHHLLALCREFSVEPDYFFHAGTSSVMVPSHRTRRRARINPARQELAIQLAQDYVPLCEGVSQPVVQPVVRVADAKAVGLLASSFRKMAGLADAGKPMDFESAFTLLGALGICVIFRSFPAELKDYAFYTRIVGHRVVFVNTDNSVLDLIFPMLHEAVHAVRDETPPSDEGYNLEEEDFCDQVAGAAQFPPQYVDSTYGVLRGLDAAGKVTLLKSLAAMHHHTVYGVATAIGKAHQKLGLSSSSIHGADGNLRKTHPTLRDILFKNADTPDAYLERLRSLSPIFFNILKTNVGAVSTRRLADLLELPNVLDAKDLKDVLAGHGGGEACISCATHAAY